MITLSFITEKLIETGSTLKIVDRPLFRRVIVDFLMKILGTIPKNAYFRFYRRKIDQTGSPLKYVKGLKPPVLPSEPLISQVFEITTDPKNLWKAITSG